MRDKTARGRPLRFVAAVVVGIGLALAISGGVSRDGSGDFGALVRERLAGQLPPGAEPVGGGPYCALIGGCRVEVVP